MIYITTLGRAYDQKTLKNMRGILSRHPVTLVVQAHEYLAHHEIWGGQVPVLPLPENIRTLGPTRRWVYEHARSNGDHSLIMLDDDLDFYIREDPDDWHLTTPDDAQLAGMFDEVLAALNAGYMHVGVSGREGNNRVSEYFVEDTRYMRLLAYRTDMPDDVVHGRIDGMSDFDLNLQLLRRGHSNKVFYRYAQGQSGTQTPGGCSLNRTLQTHSDEVDFMVREHYPHVRRRMKQNKGGGEFGTRPEVTIYWKKAREEGESQR